MITFTSRRMTRCSVARKIPPFDAGLELPVTPVQGVDHTKDQATAHTRSARCHAGANRHDIEVGRHRQFAQKCAEPLHGEMPPIDTSGVRRMKLNMPRRRLRANRSLTISIVGMRPRTMRSWLDMS
jgi:hypothetical protein